MSNTKTFVKQIRKGKVSLGYEMVSFDVTPLFTNVSLDKTIDIIGLWEERFVSLVGLLVYEKKEVISKW